MEKCKIIIIIIIIVNLTEETWFLLYLKKPV